MASPPPIELVRPIDTSLQPTESNANDPTTPHSATSSARHLHQDSGIVKKLSAIQAIRKWPWISVWQLALSSGIILTGFDLSIVSNVASLPAFQVQYGTIYGDKYILPALWLGVWNASIPIGAIVGALAAGLLQDVVGRRAAVAAASLLSAACVAAAFFSDQAGVVDAQRGVFLVAKTMQGFATGMMLCTVETWQSEVLPPALRGPGIALYPIFTLLGQLVGAVVVQAVLDVKYTVNYRLALATQWPFTALPLIVSLLMPESPTWLVRMGRLDGARKSLARLGSTRDDGDVDAELQGLKRIIQLEREQSGNRKVGYIECFKGTDSRRSWIILFARVIPSFFGLPLFSTASYFLQVLNVPPRLSLLFTLIGVVIGLFSNFVSFWTLTTFGRRPLIIVSMAGAAVMWASIGIAGCFPSTLPAVQWYVIVGMMVTISLVGVAAWPASHVVAVEASSLRLRSRSQGIAGVAANLVMGVVSIFLPYIYNQDQGNGGARVGFLFAFLCLVGTVLSWLFIPEMKDRTVEAVDSMFELRLPARAFASWRREGDEELEGREKRPGTQEREAQETTGKIVLPRRLCEIRIGVV
ncbi:hypothetical protein MGG_02346 [Pyricularia oryzae 70-15]|uniref:Major facilitator superfamily (MFS) profile domain-containing protein n=1 Tax=Pyricularia oryzae (strain 70-15 / ATCC MYA-4617 / FGSC 8958) TaxID=242507 RepID=G4MQL3_PYRO7|nr:uncharacterized protein MGG_02346 [Pyricularia oryzae 70-15]EHA56503.1 hypothetical protein MGG_02346 [Pyricularia oryzae 70-15]KAI7912832.1 hypothetical protein M9X92_009803 [Pyricularia oryzae]